MAYDRNNDDRKPAFPALRVTGSGNMVEDPKDIGKDSPFVVFKMAFNSRNGKEYEGSIFVSASVGSTMAERVLEDGAKGKRLFVSGLLYIDEPWENKDGDLVPSYSLRIDEIGESWRFASKSGGGSNRRSRGGDDEDEPRGRSGRSSRRGGDDDDEPRGRSGRSSRGSDDEGDNDSGGRSGRSSRRSRDEDTADEPRAGRNRRSRGAVEDNGDDD